jgi:hypothetical protein
MAHLLEHLTQQFADHGVILDDEDAERRHRPLCHRDIIIAQVVAADLIRVANGYKRLVLRPKHPSRQLRKLLRADCLAAIDPE